MIDTDRSNNSLRNQRVRVGLYTFHDTMSSPPEDAVDTVSPAPDDTSPLPKDPNHE
jgi:hypothetical protein